MPCGISLVSWRFGNHETATFALPFFVAHCRGATRLFPLPFFSSWEKPRRGGILRKQFQLFLLLPLSHLFFHRKNIGTQKRGNQRTHLYGSLPRPEEKLLTLISTLQAAAGHRVDMSTTSGVQLGFGLFRSLPPPCGMLPLLRR